MQKNSVKNVKKIVSNACISCIRCGVCYHKSCASVLEDKKKKFFGINENKMVCYLHVETREIDESENEDYVTSRNLENGLNI
jgi:hypothetical protein